MALFPDGIPPQKRLFDLALTLPLLLLTLPVMGLAALAILLADGAPVLFRQPRPGYRGRIFTNLKFRSMRNAVNRKGRPLPDEERLYPLGNFLRSSSLDELPELFNVIKGEMSLVGPRPLLVAYLERYTPEQMRRHDVLPGITGWAQVNGRNAISWEEKFTLDLWYVDYWSLWLDMKILALTVLPVLSRRGVQEPGQATAREFKGRSLRRKKPPKTS